MQKTTIQGWCDFEDYYNEIVSLIPLNAKVVELGPWLGKSTVFLALAIKRSGNNGATIYAVDWFKGTLNDGTGFASVTKSLADAGKTPFEEFMLGCTKFGVRDMIMPITCDSVEAAYLLTDKTIDYIFFDTEHTEDRLTREIDAWLPKLKPKGMMGGHDVDRIGIKTAVDKKLPGWVNKSTRCWHWQAP